MKRAAFWGALCVSSALAACDLPAVVFDGPGGGTTTTSGGAAAGGGGTAASGGTTGGTDSTTSGSGATGGMAGVGGATTSGSGGGGPVLQCNFPMVSYCDPGQVCCLDKAVMDPVDHCASPGGCQPSSKYGELQCHADSDCAAPSVCCLYYVVNVMMKLEVQESYCDTACEETQELAACSGDADCAIAPNTTCSMVLGSAYPDYKFCYVP